MPSRELLAASQRVQFTELPATFDDRVLTRFYTLSDDDMRLASAGGRRMRLAGPVNDEPWARAPTLPRGWPPATRHSSRTEFPK
jgi:hypothetical protein